MHKKLEYIVFNYGRYDVAISTVLRIYIIDRNIFIHKNY